MRKNELEERLISLLGGIASYNDKGFYWMRHGEGEIASQHQKFKDSLNEILELFGEKSLTKEALEIFTSENVLCDGNGKYQSIVKDLLRKQSFYSE